MLFKNSPFNIPLQYKWKANDNNAENKERPDASDPLRLSPQTSAAIL